MRKRRRPSVHMEIDVRVQAVTTTSSILGNENGDHSFVQSFQHSDILLGGLVGQGSFADVFQVRGFVLGNNNNTHHQGEEEDGHDHWSSSCTNDNDHHHHQSSFTPRFVLKQVKQRLISDYNNSNSKTREDLIQATRDLILEAKYLARFDHPNIVKLRGTSSIHQQQQQAFNSPFFLILDQVDQTLTEQIQLWKQEHIQQDTKPSASLSRTQNQLKLRYAWQLASALQYLHNRRIVYRDVKGDNVGLLWGDGSQSSTSTATVKLLDFGLCRELPPAQEETEGEGLFQMTMVGTRRYCAPEVVVGQGYNTKADVYSWAILVHEMISLSQPYAVYDHRQAHEEFVCHQGIRPEFLSKLKWSRDLKKLLIDSWQGSVKERISMEEVCYNLETILMDLPPSSSSHTQYVIDSSAVEQDMYSQTAHTNKSFDTEDTALSSCGTSVGTMDLSSHC